MTLYGRKNRLVDRGGSGVEPFGEGSEVAAL